MPGLRRNEVAMLAGVSVEYYTRLERGNLGGVSDAVLDALSRALRLDTTEREHLYVLARAAGGGAAGSRQRSRSTRASVRPGVQRMIEAISTLPACVTNKRFDIVLTNGLGRALYADVYADPTAGGNTAWFVFLNPSARRFYRDWEVIAATAVGVLRVEASKNPYDRSLSDLIGELSTRSDDFRVMWGSQDVRVFRDGTKRFDHPVVGHLELDHQTMFLSSAEELAVAVYSAAPDSPSEDGLKLLASWAATAHETAPTPAELDR